MKTPVNKHWNITPILEDLGWSASDVADDLDIDGFTVPGSHPDHGTVMFAPDKPVMTRIEWEKSIRQPAIRAMQEDFARALREAQGA